MLARALVLIIAGRAVSFSTVTPSERDEYERPTNFRYERKYCKDSVPMYETCGGCGGARGACSGDCTNDGGGHADCKDISWAAGGVSTQAVCQDGQHVSLHFDKVGCTGELVAQLEEQADCYMVDQDDSFFAACGDIPPIDEGDDPAPDDLCTAEIDWENEADAGCDRYLAAGYSCVSTWSEFCAGDNPAGAEFNDSPLSISGCSQCTTT
uniref:Uncharacterized protein n=1 Tax=Coccolithus braarudii TaxID=221442 RepID=A0A7S0Q6Y5_9EUKA